MRVSSRLLLAFLAVIVVLVIPTGYAMLRLGELQTLAVGGRDRQAVRISSHSVRPMQLRCLTFTLVGQWRWSMSSRSCWALSLIL